MDKAKIWKVSEVTAKINRNIPNCGIYFCQIPSFEETLDFLLGSVAK